MHAVMLPCISLFITLLAFLSRGDYTCQYAGDGECLSPESANYHDPLAVYFSVEDTEDETELFRRGHMKPLGYHRPPERITEELAHMIAPEDFHQHYVARHRPVIIRNAVKYWNATWRWTDEYLASRFGDVAMKMETKDDNKYNLPPNMRFNEFLDIYKTKDLYMVDEVLPQMREDVTLPTCLRCEEMTDRFFVSYFWMSYGGTSSQIHVDTDENLLCIIHGAKTLLLISPLYSHELHADETQIVGVSMINPLSVDFERFPLAKNIRYEIAHINAGDLIYIPQFWWHHVISHSGRQQAVALWWKSRPVGKPPGSVVTTYSDGINPYSYASALVYYEQWVLNVSDAAPRLKCNMQRVLMSDFVWETDREPDSATTKEHGYDDEELDRIWENNLDTDDEEGYMKTCQFNTRHDRNPCLLKECQLHEQHPVCLRYIIDYCQEVEDKACAIEIPQLLNKLYGEEFRSIPKAKKWWGEDISKR